jgi:hypothetical protein
MEESPWKERGSRKFVNDEKKNNPLQSGYKIASAWRGIHQLAREMIAVLLWAAALSRFAYRPHQLSA